MQFHPIRAFKRFSKSFLNETSGNVAIIAGLAIIPIIGIVGLAIDFQLVVTKKNTVQQTLDATMIAVAREQQSGEQEATIRAFADNYFDTLLQANDPGIICESLNLTFLQTSEQIDGNIICRQPTTLSAIFGRDEFVFEVGSGSTFGIGQVDVAFVFDLSGSMNNNGRLDALRTASNSALDVLLDADNEATRDVRVGISTYNHSVNAGQYFEDVTAENRRPNAIEASEPVGDVYEDNYIGVRQIDARNGRTFFDFETIRRNNNGSFTDFAGRFYYEDTCVYQNFEGEFNANDPADEPVIAGHPLWDYEANRGDENNSGTRNRKDDGQDELMSREGEFRTRFNPLNNSTRSSTSGVINTNSNSDISNLDSEGTLTASIRFGNNINDNFPLMGCRPDNEPVPLTSDESRLRDFIRDMEAGGGTAGHLGISWGWNILSPEWKDIWPLTSEPLPYDEPDTTKALIIMTDGEFNATHPMAAGTSTELSAGYCDAIKQDTNIVIFTIGFEVPNNVSTVAGSGGQTILEYCASGPNFAFEADGSSQLQDAFVSIASTISDLRIAQ